MQMRANYLENNVISNCFGCGACEAVCPTQAIKMEEDERGFLHPVIDNSKCIDCGKCHKICPDNVCDSGKINDTFYVAHHKDQSVISHSQSGGMFTLISDEILERDGVIYGAGFDCDFKVIHKRTDNKNGRDELCYSKYTQSVIDKSVYENIKQDLEQDKWVLFVGTPCQAYAVKKTFGNDKLICMDFICHGVPSPKLWKDYLEYRRKMWGPIEKVQFRNPKLRNRGNHSESIFTQDGVEHISTMYSAFFYAHIAHRDSCFRCPFAMEARLADITIGGFLDAKQFGIAEEYQKSVVMCNTDKGELLWKSVLDKAIVKKLEMKRMNNQPCLYNHISKPAGCDKFWIEFKSNSIDYLYDSYITDELRRKYRL